MRSLKSLALAAVLAMAVSGVALAGGNGNVGNSNGNHNGNLNDGSHNGNGNANRGSHNGNYNGNWNDGSHNGNGNGSWNTGSYNGRSNGNDNYGNGNGNSNGNSNVPCLLRVRAPRGSHGGARADWSTRGKDDDEAMHADDGGVRRHDHRGTRRTGPAVGGPAAGILPGQRGRPEQYRPG